MAPREHSYIPAIRWPPIAIREPFISRQSHPKTRVPKDLALRTGKFHGILDRCGYHAIDRFKLRLGEFYMESPFFQQVTTVRGHTFIPAPLNRSSTVVDLGAHLGEFSQEMATRFGCRCVAVEANPNLIDQVRAATAESLWVRCYRPRRNLHTFYLSDSPEASTLSTESNMLNGQSVNVPTYSLETLLNKFGISRAFTS